MIAYLDTQVAVWLHAGSVGKLSREAKRQLENNDLLISPMVLLEFQYLRDRRRIRVDAMPLYNYLDSTFGVRLCDFPFAATVVEALSIGWTTDPFDRIIVAHAKANRESILITADEKIQEHYRRAVW